MKEMTGPGAVWRRFVSGPVVVVVAVALSLGQMCQFRNIENVRKQASFSRRDRFQAFISNRCDDAFSGGDLRPCSGAGRVSWPTPATGCSKGLCRARLGLRSQARLQHHGVSRFRGVGMRVAVARGAVDVNIGVAAVVELDPAAGAPWLTISEAPSWPWPPDLSVVHATRQGALTLALAGPRLGVCPPMLS